VYDFAEGPAGVDGAGRRAGAEASRSV
jgi:hypothetical protein